MAFVMKISCMIVAALMMGGPVGADQPVPWQLGFQESVTPVMDKIIELHTFLMFILSGIAIFVTLLLVYVAWRFRAKKNPVASKTSHHTFLEIIWTAIPAIIVLAITYPSVKLIYYMDKAHEPELTIKAIGHQWYWSYEYPDQKFSFESYMVQDKDIKPGQVRLLEVDNAVVVPVDTTVRLLVTSADVLHSWAIPAFGVKKDAVTGRINETWFRVRKEGTYYGQCSELCGSGHGFMPIAVRVVSKEEFSKWIKEGSSKFTVIDIPKQKNKK